MSQVAVQQPLWLLAPLIFLLLYLTRPRSRILPAGWMNIVTTELRAYLSQAVVAMTSPWRRFAVFALFCLLGAALAAISIDRPQQPDPRNLHGRYLVLDLGPDLDERAIVMAARGFLAQTFDAPTGIIAVAGRAFDIVPITTDQTHIDRYLQVLEADMIPLRGRAPLAGLMLATEHLQRSKIVAGQIVLFSQGDPPGTQSATSFTDIAIAADVWIMLPSSDLPAWREIAGTLDARLTTPGDSDAVTDALAEQRAVALRNATPVSDRQELTAWLILAALPVWLLTLFRRRVA